ncbi:kinase-like protein [Cristinia sonorae]|uniref:Kinase-like protein n=1 Tax=Cristinia sonorae TaxID=1940300 RepID=A0A8K0XMW5_9AGAR|nr:kinase-like protein [Cristinia sonorae]
MKSLFEFNIGAFLPPPGLPGSFSEITVATSRDPDPENVGGQSVVVIKSASTAVETSTEPHDIARELKILSGLSHTNVIEVLGHFTGDVNNALHFWMPHVRYSLTTLLDCPVFGLGTEPANPFTEDFVDLARSILYQLTSALAYLHHPSQGVAHRDIKPGNILITESGCVKLIDFGVSWSKEISPSSDCLWPEPQGSLCFDVSTGHYRAPELLFGARDYDPYATDLWSLGVLASEFFTALKQGNPDSGFDSDEEDRWHRTSLFNAERGSIGLAWSIFQVRGTPNEENWPGFKSLPDGSKVTFEDVPPVDLVPLLPNAPPGDHPTFTGSHSLPPETSNSPVDLIYRLLVYPPEKRLRAEDALRHPWFTSEPLLLPDEYPQDQSIPLAVKGRTDGRSLGDILATFTFHETFDPSYDDSGDEYEEEDEE